MQSSVTSHQSSVSVVSRQSFVTSRESLVSVVAQPFRAAHAASAGLKACAPTSRGRWMLVVAVPLMAQRGTPGGAISDKPDTPFTLATFEAAGKVRVGLVLQTRVLDVVAANDALTKSAGLPAVRVPAEMRELIESYDRI